MLICFCSKSCSKKKKIEPKKRDLELKLLFGRFCCCCRCCCCCCSTDIIFFTSEKCWVRGKRFGNGMGNGSAGSGGGSGDRSGVGRDTQCYILVYNSWELLLCVEHNSLTGSGSQPIIQIISKMAAIFLRQKKKKK